MNYQRIYEKVARHLLKQKAQSIANGGCAYRGENGLKCAIGCLIPDRLYRPEFDTEQFSVWDLMQQPELSRLWKTNDESQVDASFLTKLQSIHDDHCPGLWVFWLKRFAKDYGLKPVEWDK